MHIEGLQQKSKDLAVREGPLCVKILNRSYELTKLGFMYNHTSKNQYINPGSGESNLSVYLYIHMGDQVRIDIPISQFLSENQ